MDEWLARWSHVLWINVLLQIQMTADYSVYKVGWADKEWSSTNNKYNKHRPSSRLTKGIAKYFLVFEMSLGYSSEVLILMK